MTIKEKGKFVRFHIVEAKRYKTAKGDTSIRPPKSGYDLFRALCYNLVQQRYRTTSN